VDDDATVADVVRRYLERDGYAVQLAGDGETALRLAELHKPDLVVLDLMLPGIDGLEVCRRLRAGSDVPIVMLTALGEESDRVVGLQHGADDYVTKPFSPRELALRVASVLRRARAGAGEHEGPRVLRDGDLEVDAAARRAIRHGAELALTGRELDLLIFLLRNPGQAFDRVALLERVWGWTFGDHSTVTVHVRRLREKVEDDPASPRRIATVWGVGYRYDPVGSGVG
jgi:DNA-binding response OmpR family regulator